MNEAELGKLAHFALNDPTMGRLVGKLLSELSEVKHELLDSSEEERKLGESLLEQERATDIVRGQLAQFQENLGKAVRERDELKRVLINLHDTITRFDQATVHADIVRATLIAFTVLKSLGYKPTTHGYDG